MLKEGVPPLVIARVLEMDPDHVRGAASNMRVGQYGTDDISDAMTHLIWIAVEEAEYQIKYGSPANKHRFMQLVLAGSIRLAGRTNSDASDKIRNALMKLAQEAKPEVMLGDSIYTPTE